MKTESKPKLHKATRDYLESVAKRGDENARALLHNVRAFSILNAKQQKATRKLVSWANRHVQSMESTYRGFRYWRLESGRWQLDDTNEFDTLKGLKFHVDDRIRNTKDNPK